MELRSCAAVALLILMTTGCSEGGERHRGDPSDAATPDDTEVTDAADPSDVRDSGADGRGDSELTRDASEDADAGEIGPPPGPDPDCNGDMGDGELPEGTIAGEITTPHPTLTNVTVEWAVEGDEDLDAEVRVRYRPEGTQRWWPAMPLRRVPADSNEGHSWGNRHSGSVFNLDPGTRYEIELWLQDPDGGCRVDTVVTETRPLPAPMANAPVTQVTPETLSSALSNAQPGDILELEAGTYDAFSIPNDGAPGRPIVIRSTQGAVVDGTVNASDRQYVHIVGLRANRIRFDHSKRVAIMNNRVTLARQYDSIGAWNRAEDAYVADNVVTSTTSWDEDALGVSGDNFGECIIVTGPGHVIAHNEVRGCRDNISFLEGDNAVDQHSIDVIGNDIYTAADDGVEADFCAHNCRIMQNRFTNVFIALSSQPGLGGPTYFIRNVVYSNLYRAAFKLHRGSIGDVVLHNTIVKTGDALAVTAGRAHARQYFRNNLLIGGEGATHNGYFNGDGRIVYLPDAVDGDFDYDGLGSTVGNFSGRIGDVTFGDFAELRANTTYAHAVEVDLSVFAQDVALPVDAYPGYEPVDLRLAPGSAAVDRAAELHNINDGYTGQAPDLGAHELGDGLPVYGPRD